MRQESCKDWFCLAVVSLPNLKTIFLWLKTQNNSGNMKDEGIMIHDWTMNDFCSKERPRSRNQQKYTLFLIRNDVFVCLYSEDGFHGIMFYDILSRVRFALWFSETSSHRLFHSKKGFKSEPILDRLFLISQTIFDFVIIILLTWDLFPFVSYDLRISEKSILIWFIAGKELRWFRIYIGKCEAKQDHL